MKDMPGEASRISLYIRIASSLRTRIGASEWQPGEQIPTIDELAEEYEVSRITVRQAVALLVQDGLLTSTRGRGTFVDDRHEAAATRTPINTRLDLTEGQTIRMLDRERIGSVPQRFQPTDNPFDEYVLIRKLHLHLGEPFALIDSVVAAPIYDQFPPEADQTMKLLQLVANHATPKIAHSRQQITISYADQATAELLRCSLTGPLVKIKSWRRDSSRKLLLATITLYRADRFLYDIEEHNVPLQDSSALVIPRPTSGSE